MAKMSTPDLSTVSQRQLHDAGINPFAVDLLVESYANPKRTSPLVAITFLYRGVVVSLRPYEIGSEQVDERRMYEEGEHVAHEIRSGAIRRASGSVKVTDG